MGQVVRKIQCVGGTHEDRTPSLAVYDDGSGYCFACNVYFPNIQEPTRVEVTQKEDLNERFNYIDSLPFESHRGLRFRADSRGYYIVWPSRDYYKLRLWAPRPGEPKYLGAKGHRKPWFLLDGSGSRTCVLTEGEINALSLKEVYPEVTIISPGGATNFYDQEMKNNVHLFSKYGRLLVLVDEDDAGVKGAIEFHKLVRPYNTDVEIILMERGQDSNELLQSGHERLKAKVGL